MAGGPATKLNTEDLHYEGDMECHMPFSKTSNRTVVIQYVGYVGETQRPSGSRHHIYHGITCWDLIKLKTIGNDQYTASLSMNCCQSV